MYRHQLLLSQLFFGFDAEHLYLRMDFRDLPDKVTVRLDILSPEPIRLSITPTSGSVNVFMFENNTYEKKAELESVAFEEILEFKVPFTMLGVVPKQRIRFFLSLRENELELERHPSNGLLSLIIPENDYEKVMWYV
jgi:hypothetical protein